jgi:hypothetical protein
MVVYQINNDLCLAMSRDTYNVNNQDTVYFLTPKLVRLVCGIFILFLSGALSAQEREPSFLDKVNQNSVSFEFPISISYSYAHKFNPNVTLGARVQGGLGMPITLYSTPISYNFGYDEGPQEVKPGSQLEVLKLQLFYRHALSKSIYFDVGPFASVSPLGEAGWEKPLKTGVEFSAYYSIRKIHIGLRFNGALCFDAKDTNVFTSDDTYYVFELIPLVIGFSF